MGVTAWSAVVFSSLGFVSEPDVHNDSTDLLRRIHVDLAKQKEKGIHADSCSMIFSSISCSWIFHLFLVLVEASSACHELRPFPGCPSDLVVLILKW